ncbi:putative odorant-binding protein A10 [Arctopsyche grandis]|uniref:putative odorant-binding protein A10 n=1 Tax=Arctopsyche grandis TaxID=121162 RepID=UPI00406D93C3
MKNLVCLACIFVIISVATAATTARPQVTDDALDNALNDKRYLQRQLKCALGEGACDPVGRRLKSLAPLVLRGSCPQCSAHETRQIQKILSHIQKNYPKDWSKIIRQYSGI